MAPPLPPLPPGPQLEDVALAALRRPAGVRVFDLSRELGLEIRVAGGLLRSLRGRGLATAAQEGTPPITTWRATT